MQGGDGSVYTRIMKKVLTLFALIITFSANAQIDSFVYDSIRVYRIDTSIIYGEGDAVDTITSDSNYVWCYYHYIQTTGDSFLYQPQFFIRDSTNKELLPNVDMEGVGWGASGTRLDNVYIDSTDASLTPDSLRTLYILPIMQSIFGSSNVTKLE